MCHANCVNPEQDYLEQMGFLFKGSCIARKSFALIGSK